MLVAVAGGLGRRHWNDGRRCRYCNPQLVDIASRRDATRQRVTTPSLRNHGYS